jgi:hypothetical protein
MVQSQSPQWSLLEDGRWLATFVGGDTGLLTAVQGRLSGRGGGPNLARALATLVVAAGEIEEAVRARARGS